MCERELKTEQNSNILTPTLLAITSFRSPFSWAAQLGSWGPSLSGTCSHSSIFSPTRLISKLRVPSAGCWLSLPHLVTDWLNFLCTELYNISPPTFFLWASQIALIHPIHGQGYTLLFLDRIHQLFTQVHFLFWLPGRIVGQYTTLGVIAFKKNSILPRSGSNNDLDELHTSQIWE